MKRYIITAALVTCIGFSYGLRPSFDVNAGWQYLHISSHGASATGNFAVIGIGTTAPYFRYMGLSASVFGIALGEDQTSLGVAGRIGFIEMIPTKYVSPYFVQNVMLDFSTSGGDSYTNLFLEGGLGIEFLTSYYVSPFIEGSFGWEHSDLFGFSLNTIGISVRGGVKFSWIK
ncbi:MAG TPA: hypothetical protein VF399_00815 [bacterium]|jgi:hypothetical protein